MFPLSPSVWSISWQIRVQTITVVSWWKLSHIAKWLNQCNWNTPTIYEPCVWMLQIKLTLSPFQSPTAKEKDILLHVISNGNKGLQIHVRDSTRLHVSVWFCLMSCVLKIQVTCLSTCFSANHKMINAPSPWWNPYEWHILTPKGNDSCFYFIILRKKRISGCSIKYSRGQTMS